MPLDYGEHLRAISSESIDDPVRPLEHLAYVVPTQLGNPSARDGRHGCALCGRHEEGNPSSSCRAVVTSDDVADRFQIGQGPLRPHEGEPLARSLARTPLGYHSPFPPKRLFIRRTAASCECTRPSSASARPLSTAATNRARSVSSSKADGDRITPAGFPFCVMTKGAPVCSSFRIQLAAWALKSLTGTKSSEILKVLLGRRIGLNIDRIPPHSTTCIGLERIPGNASLSARMS